MKTFEKIEDKLRVVETKEVSEEFTMGQIDNEILRLETELEKFKALRDEGEKKGLREIFNIPKVVNTELKDIITE